MGSLLLLLLFPFWWIDGGGGKEEEEEVAMIKHGSFAYLLLLGKREGEEGGE